MLPPAPICDPTDQLGCLSYLDGKMFQTLTSHQQLLEVGNFNQHACNLGSKIRSVDKTLLTWSLSQDIGDIVVDELAKVTSPCRLIDTSERLACDEL